ncbi:acyltransferase family protein [Rathayibacter sp. YIM 133350]|uniref:acyltransferase family protein n=1 Tax=Rathayibacter sp. YIM 133350 TaxID=3131992 RepID=UPI00307EAEF3
MSTAAGLPRTVAGRRVPLWDNARWIAIVLVVVGHGILPLIHESDAAYSVYLFVYAFHMPVFVVVSGYFAKSAPPGPRQLKRVITDIVLPYLIFETVWTVIRWALGGKFWLDYATASWTLWFLIALAVWRIVLPYLVLLRWPLTISIIVSVFVGYFPSIDSTFALSRTIGLLPFFVFGWALRQRQITGRWLALPPRVVWRWRAGALALFAVLAVLIALNITALRTAQIRQFLLYDLAYPAIGYDAAWAGALRLGLILLAIVLVLAFLMLMPRRPTPFTALGAATMYIYLLHTFFLYPLRETPVLQGPQPLWVLPGVIAVCIAIAVLLSQPFVRRIFHPVVEPKARWLFRAEPHTATGTLVLPPDIR